MRYLWLAFLIACSPAVPTPKDEATVAQYTAELQACVVEASTFDQAQACMCDTAKKFGRGDAGVCR